MKPNFDLISKTIGMSFVKYKGNATRLSVQTPAKVDEIILGLKDNHGLTRKVTTFRNSKGEVIERSFDYFDKPYRNRIYTRDAHIIQEDEFVSSTTIKDYILSRETIEDYKDLLQIPRMRRDILWSHINTTTNHMSENEKNGEKVLTQTTIIPVKGKNQKRHTFIEFPHIINNQILKKFPKFLSFNVRNKDNTVVKKSIESKGVKIPENDYFLGFRALTKDDSKEPFTQHFLKEKNLDDANIKIDKAYNPLNESHSGFMAKFDADEGIIKFNKDYRFKSKSQVVSTSAHETEHAKQYFLQALLNGGNTPWQTEMAQKFGELKDPELIKKAKIYDEAIENYVPFWRNQKAYKENTIEKLANEEGFTQENIYNMLGNTIRADFQHIPKELL